MTAVNPLEFDYITNIITGEKIPIEMNEDIKVDTITPCIISSALPFEISEKTSLNKKSIIGALNLKQGRKIYTENINTSEIAKIDKDTIKKSISNIKSGVNYNDFFVIVYNCDSLFRTSQKILSHSDAKTNKKIKIKRYANIVSIDKNCYLLEFILKDNGQISLYSVDIINNYINKQYREDTLKNLNNSSQQHDTVIFSISNISSIFKSKVVEKYNIDYRRRIKSKK